MKPARLLLLAFLFFVCVGDGAAQTIGLKRGALVIVGGGNVGPEIWERFITLAGGPNAHFVFIPTAAEDPIKPPSGIPENHPFFKLKHITVLHTRSREEANSEAFVAVIRKASGVWFGGGRQWRLVDSYLGTRTHEELNKLLARGGVIGGTSAGATIQGSYLVRGAREGNTIMMAKGYEEGLGFLRGVAIDQHLNTRKREADLGPVIAAHPELLGIGLDESTAIIVRGDEFEIIGPGRVAVNDGRDHDGKPYYFLKAGDRFDLKARRRK